MKLTCGAALALPKLMPTLLPMLLPLLMLVPMLPMPIADADSRAADDRRC